MKKRVVLLVGVPGSTKTTYATSQASKAGVVVLSRDRNGGTLKGLIPEYTRLLKDTTTHTVIVDNTHLTRDQRALFLQPAADLKVPVHVLWFNTPMEDAEIRILRRPAPRIPPFAMVRMQRSFQRPDPTLERGLVSVKVLDVPRPRWETKDFRNKALFLDVDGTLRDVSHLPRHYPIKAGEVRLIRPAKEMCAVLETWVKKGYVLIAVSNQSGVATGVVSDKQVRACFQKVSQLLGHCVRIHFFYCNHFASSAGCYCRKPHTGLIVDAAHRYKVNPHKSVMVGDRDTDALLAKRVGCRFVWAADFW